MVNRTLAVFLLTSFLAFSIHLQSQAVPATGNQQPQPTQAAPPPQPVPVAPAPTVSPQAMQDLGTRLAARINAIRAQDPRSAHAIWGISVVDLATGSSLYAENADKLLHPASNTKLFTTATTLALVGPDYKFLTTIESA
ncbi:MAG TPA: D-alanyl-D-alanine carboxypeptidase, partial [Candidatus Sulfotelmatobacter sp.]|nr:D-alanyl-D-alanine carboxypeptidase [Candidatus Sulfotelmatobacter sp.]